MFNRIILVYLSKGDKEKELDYSDVKYTSLKLTLLFIQADMGNQKICNFKYGKVKICGYPERQ